MDIAPAFDHVTRLDRVSSLSIILVLMVEFRRELPQTFRPQRDITAFFPS
jgi:hypothetical protein